MDNVNNQQNNNNNIINSYNEPSQFTFTRNIIDHAINNYIPPIKIACEPKINHQKEGGMIIKGLINSIEKDFKRNNPRHNDLIGFDSWYIDSKGDICCITNDIDLFIFLCENEHIPNMIEHTYINIIRPRNLPPQRSIIIKGVPNYSRLEDIKDDITNKYKSIYYIDEIIGTNNGKTRFLRMDLLNVMEYRKILNAGVVCVDGQCLHVHEYLASPKVIFCPICNIPGHTKRQCKLGYERCKRCGGNRKEGEHKECIISCHNCQDEHIATDFRCPLVKTYRKELIQYLRQHPELLPYGTQIFIPSSLRQDGIKVLGKRSTDKDQNVYQYNSNKNKNNSKYAWPSLAPSSYVNEQNSNIKDLNINLNENLNTQEFLTQIKNQCYKTKKEYENKLGDTTMKINKCFEQIQSLINCFSSTIQRQNEMMYVLKTSLTECMEIIKITNQTLCMIMDKSDNQHFAEMIKQISAIPLDERQASINKFFSAYSPLIDEITMKITDTIDHLQIPND